MEQEERRIINGGGRERNVEVEKANMMFCQLVKERTYMRELGVFLTGTFLGAPGPLAVHPQLTAKVLLPELSKPDVPAVVGQRAALEVTIERCQKKLEHVVSHNHSNI